MNRSPLSFRTRIVILAIVAIAWLAMTRESPTAADPQVDVATPTTSQVVVAGKTSDDRDHR